jgi:hypothetical protein
LVTEAREKARKFSERTKERRRGGELRRGVKESRSGA